MPPFLIRWIETPPRRVGVALAFMLGWAAVLLILRNSHWGMILGGPVTGLRVVSEFVAVWMAGEDISRLLPFLVAITLLTVLSLYLFLVNLTRWVKHGRGLKMALLGYLAGLAGAFLVTAAGS